MLGLKWHHKIPIIVKKAHCTFHLAVKSQLSKRWKCFWRASHPTENSENSTRKIGSKENSRHEIFESLGILREVVFVFTSSEKCCFIHLWKFRAIQTKRFGRMENAFDILDDPHVVKWLVTWVVHPHDISIACLSFSYVTEFLTNIVRTASSDCANVRQFWDPLTLAIPKGNDTLWK